MQSVDHDILWGSQPPDVHQSRAHVMLGLLTMAREHQDKSLMGPSEEHAAHQVFELENALTMRCLGWEAVIKELRPASTLATACVEDLLESDHLTGHSAVLVARYAEIEAARVLLWMTTNNAIEPMTRIGLYINHLHQRAWQIAQRLPKEERLLWLAKASEIAMPAMLPI